MGTGRNSIATQGTEAAAGDTLPAHYESYRGHNRTLPYRLLWHLSFVHGHDSRRWSGHVSRRWVRFDSGIPDGTHRRRGSVRAVGSLSESQFFWLGERVSNGLDRSTRIRPLRLGG